MTPITYEDLTPLQRETLCHAAARLGLVPGIRRDPEALLAPAFQRIHQRLCEQETAALDFRVKRGTRTSTGR